MQKGYEFTQQLVKAAKPHCKSPIAELARHLGKSQSWAEKILQQPPSEDFPEGNGILNPVDGTDSILNFALQYAPEFAVLLVSRYQEELDAHKRRQAQAFFIPTQSDFEAQVRRFFTEKADVMIALATNAPADTLEREWEEAAQEFRQLLAIKRAQEAAPHSTHGGGGSTGNAVTSRGPGLLVKK